MNIIDQIKSDLKTRTLYQEVLVTPHVARQLLELNTRNRPVRRGHVDSLSNQMEKGNWRFTGDTVKLSRTGIMLDSQHRLLAVIKSGKAQKFNIQTGLDDEVFDVIDTGANRTSGDVLAIAGYKSAGYVAGAAKLIMLYYKKLLGKTKTLRAKDRPTNHDVREWVEKTANEELLVECVRSGTNYYPKFKVFSPPTYAAMMYIMSVKSRDQAKEFLDKFVTGENLEKDSPIYVLRQKLINLQLERKSIETEMKYALMLKAWNLFRDGKTAKRITWGDDEEFPRAK